MPLNCLVWSMERVLKYFLEIRMKLTRIVRMTFQEDKVDAFLEIFESSKDKIAGMPGCNSVELFQDYNQGHIFSTYSIWDSEEDLNNYRKSELFGGVWKATKALFSDKPVAFSLKKI